MNPRDTSQNSRPARPPGPVMVLGYGALVLASGLWLLTAQWPIALLPLLTVPLLLVTPFYPRQVYFPMWLLWIAVSLGVIYALASNLLLTMTAVVLGGFSIYLLLELVHALAQSRRKTEEALRRRNREFSALNNVTAAVTATLELDQVLQRLVDTVAELFPQVTSATLQLLDERDGVLRTAAASSGTTPDRLAKPARFRTGEGVAGQAMAERRSINVSDVMSDRRYLPGEVPPSYRSLLVTPLVMGDRVWGTLSVTGRASDAFRFDDERLIESVARQAAIAIENAHLFEETARRAREQETVATIVRALNAHLEAEEAFSTIVDGLQALTDCQRVNLILLDEEHQQFTITALHSAPPVLEKGKTLPYSASPFITDLRAGRVHLTSDLSTEPEVSMNRTLLEAGFRSAVSVPLVVRNQVVGALNLESKRLSAFTERDVPILQQVADALAAAMVKSDLFERVRAAEAQYRGLFVNSPDPIAVLDPDGVLIDVNPAACQVSGRSREELIGRNIGSINNLPPETFRSAIDAAMGGETVTYNFATVVGGRTRYFEARLERIDQADKTVLQWISHDVTARRELDHWREELTDITVHNLRNPLTWIQTGTEAARMFLPDDVDPGVTLALDRAIKGTARLEQQIDLLLHINRAEAGQELTDKEPLSPASLVKDVIELLSPRAAAHKVRLRAELPESLPIVSGNRNMLTWILENLIDNAIKYSPDNEKVSIRICVTEPAMSSSYGLSDAAPEPSIDAEREQTSPADQAALRFSVKDRGPGVPRGDRERIFQKFYQVRRGQAAKGAGIGLYFCKLAVEAHGGRIWVQDNDDGPGSTFCFTLPL